jgi:hypothetical protein
VVESFMAVNTGRLVLVMSARNGLPSTAPKYTIPMMVVNQSMEPIRINDKLGTALILSMPASSFPFSTVLYCAVLI